MTDSHWAQVSEHLDTSRERKHDLREIFDAILWLARVKGQYRNLDAQIHQALLHELRLMRLR